MTDKNIPRAILLFSCPDSKGIVAEVTHFISVYGGNITDSNQHNDSETNTFFMRVAWDISDFDIPRDKITQAFEPIAIKYNMDWRIEFSDRKTRMAIFVSKFDHCLYDILLRNKEGEIDADIAMILSNHKDAEPIAEYFDIPFYYFPVKRENKTELEKEEISLLKKNNIDLVVLARYMQILSPEFVKEFRNKIINIHHSFLPAFAGAKPYHKAFERGVKIIGATSHYVTEDLDEGPIIEQDVVRVSHKDGIPDLIRKGRDIEKLVLSRALKLHIDHRILVFRNRTVVFD
ncbi:formyltetrahydrofolate deformylase [Spirochaetia bacterium 38H-sp]|uniref:Formyltetrahydrofolate deformylase n=1 Tax=Rarispira pelagica TaxID=3141764 RepID=A0ABU9UBP5_9SPIR